MTHIPEARPDFGLYRPVVPEDVPAVHAVAERVGKVVSKYLLMVGSDMPVRVRQDFGVTFVPWRSMQAHLQSPAGQEFDFEAFASLIRQVVKPREVSPLPLCLNSYINIKNRRNRHPQLTFVVDERYEQLQKQRRLLEAVLGPANSVALLHRADHITLVDLGDSNHPVRSLTTEQRYRIRRLSTAVLQEMALSEVALGPLVVGSNYRQPIIEV